MPEPQKEYGILGRRAMIPREELAGILETADRLQHETIREQQREMRVLEERLAKLTAENGRLVTRLEGAVGMLSMQSEAMVKLAAERDQLRADLDEADPKRETVETHILDALRLGVQTSDEIVSVWVRLPSPAPGQDRVPMSRRVHGTWIIRLDDLIGWAYRQTDHSDDPRVLQALAGFLGEIAAAPVRLTLPCGDDPEDCSFCDVDDVCVAPGETCGECPEESDPEEATAMWLDRVRGK